MVPLAPASVKAALVRAGNYTTRQTEALYVPGPLRQDRPA